MKRSIIIVLLCLLFCSCKENQEGRATDPKLNLLEYKFNKEGGSIDLYSEIGYKLQFYYDPYIYKVENPDANKPTEIKEGFDGGWYKITYILDYGYQKGIRIEVQPNDTGKERTVPFSITSGDFGCKNLYIQTK